MRRMSYGIRQPGLAPLVSTGGVLLLLFLLLAIIGPLLAPHDPLLIQMGERLRPPSMDYPLGTDHLGRCILSRLLGGMPLTLGLAAAVIVIVVAIGIPIGLLAGYAGGRLDTVLMRLADGAGALPEFLIAVAVAGFLGPGLPNVLLAIACVKWIGYARLIRGVIQSEREKEYVLASIAAGSSGWTVIRRHLLRHAGAPLAIVAAGDMGRMILLISALSYLGLGAQPPAPEWGAMLNDGRAYFQSEPQMMLYPGMAILLVVLACNLLSDGLRDRLDVRSGSLQGNPRRSAEGRRASARTADSLSRLLSARSGRPRRELKAGQEASTLPLPPEQVHSGASGQAGAEPDSRETELLRVEGLCIETQNRSGIKVIIQYVSFSIRAGEMLALVGESGSGKSMTAAAIGGLLPGHMQCDGEICFDGQRLLELSSKERKQLRGSKIGWVFQDYQGSFTPYRKLGSQLREVAQIHLALTREEARQLVLQWLARVGLPPERVYSSYSFQLSGGQRQRVALAAALLPRPTLLIADEPTTALDVVTSEQMMDLISELQREVGCAVLFITHDLRQVWRRADRMAIMRGGTIVEMGNAETIRVRPEHPYTRELLAASPRLQRPESSSESSAASLLDEGETAQAKHDRQKRRAAGE